MQRKFARSFASLEEIFEFTESFLESEGIGESVRFPVHFAVEELFTNMVKHAPGSSSQILLEVARTDGAVVVVLTDYDVEAFDVTAARQVDTTAPLSEREVGGLGLHLVHKMVDTLDYDYANRRSTITFTREIESADV